VKGNGRRPPKPDAFVSAVSAASLEVCVEADAIAYPNSRARCDEGAGRAPNQLPLGGGM